MQPRHPVGKFIKESQAEMKLGQIAKSKESNHHPDGQALVSTFDSINDRENEINFAGYPIQGMIASVTS